MFAAIRLRQQGSDSSSLRSVTYSLVGLTSLVAHQLLFASRANFGDGDSTHNAALSFSSLVHRGPVLGFRNEFLLGYGNLEWGNLRWLDPVSLAGVIGGRLVNAGTAGGSAYNQVFAGIAAVILMLLATAYLARSYQVSREVSVIAGMSSAAMAIGPGILPVILPDQYRIVPPFVTFTATAALGIGAFERLGSKGTWRSYLTFGGSLSYIILVHPHYAILPGFICAVVFLTTLVHRIAHGKSVKVQIAALTTLAVFWWSIGLIAFVRGFLTNSAAVEIAGPFSWTHLSVRPTWLLPYRSLFVRPDSGVLAVAVGVVCLVFGFRAWRSDLLKLRRLALTLASVVASLALYRASQRLWSRELGPDVGYLAWTSIPIVATAFSVGMWSLLDACPAWIRKRRGSTFLAIIMTVTCLTWPNLNPSQSFPVTATGVWKRIGQDTSLSSDPSFRGRTLVTRNVDNPLPSPQDKVFDPAFTLVAEIPVLNDYSHLLSPLSFRFNQRFLYRPEDLQIRNIPNYRKLNPRILRMIGVRYIVSDTKEIVAGYEIRQQWLEGSKDATRSMSLLEATTYNNGSYSPTSIHRSKSLSDGLEILDDPNLDPSETVVVEMDVIIPDELTSARDVVMKYVRGDLRVTATSDGHSLLVLPIEYSHCWHVSPRSSSSTDVELVRVNVLLMGIRFKGNLDADLRFRYWPLRNSGCRLADLADYRTGFGHDK